ncbi:MAG: hypothetical protein KUG64_10865 [Cycloclasticus sp.]|nr:hypothetical protein [Cycloclasticus sp.]
MSLLVWQYCCLVSGFIIGWIGIDLFVAVVVDEGTPGHYRVGCGFVGAVVAYTIVVKMGII